MAKQYDIILEIHQVKFGEGTSGSKFSHDFHCLRILHFTFPCYGNISSGQQGISGNNGGDYIFIFIATFTFIIISH